MAISAMSGTVMTAKHPDPNAIVKAAIEQQITLGREIGVQVAAYLNGRLAVDTWAGMADAKTGRAVDGDTLFNAYSVSKAVMLVALHTLADRGHLEYDAPVERYWPEYAINGKEQTTVRHVITHRAGVPQMPEGVSPDTLCDWAWMTSRIAALPALSAPGSKAMYQAMTFSWLVGELVRRADPLRRPIAQYVREEIAQPLGIEDLWFGLPDNEMARFARHVNTIPAIPPDMQPKLARAAMPPEVALGPLIYAENAQVRRAGVPAVGGIFSARACARVFALLTGTGEVDGVRLLSEETVRSLYTLRDNPDEPDQVMYGVPIPLTIGGLWRGGENPPVCAVMNPDAICHPGFGNNIAWADPDRNLAVAIFHNRMSQPVSREEDSILPIADAVRRALDVI